MRVFNASPWPPCRSAIKGSPRLRQTVCRVLWACLGVGVAAVGAVSVWPQPTAPDLGGWDKWGHFLCYAVLGANAALVSRGWRRLAVGAFLVGFGTALEVAQALYFARDGNAIDAMANGAGVAFGVVVVVMSSSLLAAPGRRPAADADDAVHAAGHHDRDRAERPRP